MFPSTDGNAASAFTLGSHGCWSTALPSSSPFKSGFACTQRSASTTSSGKVDAASICATRESDKTQSAPPGAAIAPASVARRVAHPSPGQAFAHPAAARELTRLAPTEFAASSRITEQMTKEKLTAICRMPGLATELLPTFQDHSFSGTSRESSSIEDSTSY